MESKHDTIVFGGGCFWCTEAVFQMVKGVQEVIPGYIGGKTKDPTYESVCGGDTGHAEAVKVVYDGDEVDIQDLLTIFFASHDPTTLNRQGNDIGTQYRSAIFYTTDDQRNAARDMITEINASSGDGDPVVTEVTPFDTFYEAEDYHKDYFAKNKVNPYCALVINPKTEKGAEALR